MAWCAGLIDGEGCFFVSKSQARIQVDSTSKSTIESLYRILGGRATACSRKTVSGKTVFRWCTHQNAVGETCEKLLDHLIEKKDQALLLMVYLKYPPKSAMRESIKTRLKNHKGKS